MMNELRQDPYTSMKGLRKSIQDETHENLPKDPGNENFPLIRQTIPPSVKVDPSEVEKLCLCADSFKT